MLESASNSELMVPRAATAAAIGYARGSAGSAVLKPLDRRSVVLGGFDSSALASIIDNDGDGLHLTKDDNRKIRNRTKELPWRLVCALEIDSPRGPFYGTGWLAGPRLVVTCGHCVHDVQRFGGWAIRITVRPGLAASDEPFGAIKSNQFSCAAEWLAGDKRYDIACVHLGVDTGAPLGWFPHAALDSTALVGVAGVVSGYPGFNGVHSRQLSHQAPIKEVRDRVYHEIDTTPGQSGGPLWLAGDVVTGPRVVAVHAYEKESSGGKYNSATRITPDVLDLIARWQSV